MVDGEVDLTEGGFDRAGVGGLGLRSGSGDEGGEWSEEPGAELDEEDAELQTACRETVAAGPTDPLDEAVSVNGQYLYNLTDGAHRISAFRIAEDGSLSPAGTIAVPAGAAGLAAR